MKTHIVTSEQVKDGKYIGEVDLSNFDGHIEIEADLGTVYFSGRLAATDYIWAKSGSGIKAGTYIEAGGSITAGTYIEAGGSITAGDYIKAGTYIEAGGSITAGDYIEAGGSITAGGSINCGKRIFAGLCSWRYPDQSETEIRCGKLESGEVAFGTLIETGLPNAEVNQPDPAQMTIEERVTRLEHLAAIK